MTTSTRTRKCRAQGGAANCTNPNCPEKRAFFGDDSPLRVKVLEVKPLPMGGSLLARGPTAWLRVRVGDRVRTNEPGYPPVEFTVTRVTGGSGEPGDYITVSGRGTLLYRDPWPLTILPDL